MLLVDQIQELVKQPHLSLPLLSKLNPQNYLQGLILAPTRELAIQITSTINQFVKYSNLRSTSILWWAKFSNAEENTE